MRRRSMTAPYGAATMDHTRYHHHTTPGAPRPPQASAPGHTTGVRTRRALP
ncbi:hypothetical protein [Streptomyces sp. ME19-01-6]|uniref:hypothetical protein n=1 Tax=Streptomyces sp. ME19-01-6 TaxID=3028686 RepID=UPI0029A9AAE5|nr:hypothetical protein [Streptomyces sp. ME19-01-6]MDX3224903.1 hypothetical protein [Streptomyces sp. ME19-01-6]